MTASRAFWITAPGQGEIRGEDLPALPSGAVRVRTRYSGVSRGTESLVFRGLVPESQYEVMRAPFQAGDFPGPVKYGYAAVGMAEQGPEALIGRRVFALHPHQDLFDLPADAVVPVPDRVPDRRAVLAANMETAVNLLWDAAPRIGDRIAVVGAGVVGSLAAALAARLPGTQVELVDIDPARAELAAAFGCRFVAPEEASGERDLVIHTSASAAGLATALALAGFEATVVEASWFGDRTPAVPLGESFHSRRLTIRSSQVGHVALARRARRSHQERLAFALRLLEDPAFDILLDEDGAFEDLPQIMAALAAPDARACCRVIRYSTR